MGQPAPFMHCHADDTTIHAASPADAAAILAGSISLHCQATGARMQTAKSTGMGIGCLQHLTGPDETPASHPVQQGQPSHTWASHSARTQTLRPAHSTQPSCSASTGASHAGQASGSAC